MNVPTNAATIVRCACVLLLASCAGDVGLTWNYDLSRVPTAAGVEARIRAGGCEGAVVYEDAFAAGAVGRTPSGLDEGTHSLELLVRDDACAVVGFVCDTLELPLATGEWTSIAGPSSAGPPCALGCNGGVCMRADGGLDGGVDAPGTDAPGTDAPGTDAPGTDAPGVDAPFEPCGDCDRTGDTCTAGMCVPANPATAIAVGAYATCALSGDRLYCWGASTIGQTGTGGFTDRVSSPRRVGGTGWRAVSLGAQTTCAVRDEDAQTRTYCWGSNNNGQAGIDPADGMNFASPSPQSPAAPPIVEVAVGGPRGLGIQADGALVGWGTNAHQSLSVLTDLDMRVEPRLYGSPLDGVWTDVSTSIWSSYGIRGGVLYVWGWNVEGELGTGGTGMSVRDAVAFEGTNWAQVAAGQRHACGRRADGSTYCWGRGTSDPMARWEESPAVWFECKDLGGALGIGAVDATRPERIAGLSSQQLSAWCGTCAVQDDGALMCFGANTYGELGVGDTAPRLEPAVVQPGARWTEVGVGPRHSCGIREGGALYCWGDNERLGLGVDGASSTTLPIRVVLP